MEDQAHTMAIRLFTSESPPPHIVIEYKRGLPTPIGAPYYGVLKSGRRALRM